MTVAATWQILLVDDEVEICGQVKEYLDGEVVPGRNEHLHVETCNDFEKALTQLETRRYDLLILDVRLQARNADVGIETLHAIQQCCFIPVLFYTGLPHTVRNLETAFIRVLEKTAGLPRLSDTVIEMLDTRLPAVNRALIHHVEAVQRDYMWDFVATHWKQFSDTPDRTSLAYMLARRLAISLSGPGIQALAHELGEPTETALAEGRVHPMQFYIMPPVEPSPLAGDLYRGQIRGQGDHWVLITPSCDLVQNREKADWVLLARCVPLADQEEYRAWAAGLPDPKSQTEGKLKSLVQNRRVKAQRDRFYFLPGALALVDLLVDFQQLATLPREEMNTLERLASLDSPFAESLLAQFSRFFGRLGTPDLDVEELLNRLRLSASSGKL